MRKRKRPSSDNRSRRIAVGAVVTVLTAGILSAGFFLPQFVARLADRRIESQTDTFAGDRIAVTSDARLMDMLALADEHSDEMNLAGGLVRSHSDIIGIARSLTEQLGKYGILEPGKFGEFSADAFLAANGNLAYVSDALGIDDNSATTVESEGTSGTDEKRQDIMMGVMWSCSSTDENNGQSLGLTIDDRSGKLLSFGLSLARDKKEVGEIYDRMSEDPEGMKKEIREDLEQKAEAMRQFCEESYGFRLERTEYHMEDEGIMFFSVEMIFEDEEGNEVPLVLERDLEGTLYNWN